MSEQARLNNKAVCESEETYILLSQLHTTPHITQRELAFRLNISLGKANYLLKQLIKRGIIKIHNFSHNPGKFRKVSYMLTKKGVDQKMKLTYHFLKKKEEEYTRIKREWEELGKKHTNYRDKAVDPSEVSFSNRREGCV